MCRGKLRRHRSNANIVVVAATIAHSVPKYEHTAIANRSTRARTTTVVALEIMLALVLVLVLGLVPLLVLLVLPGGGGGLPI